MMIQKAANLTGMSTAREEVPVVVSVQRNVKHIRVVVKGLLGAVAMVNVLSEKQSEFEAAEN